MHPAAFLFPLGPLRESLFPDDDLYSALAEWIAEAEGAATDAGISTSGPEARAYVLWRAYDTRCKTETATAGGAIKSIDADGEGSVTYETGKTTTPDYCAIAAQYRLGALALIEPVTADAYAGWPSVHSLR